MNLIPTEHYLLFALVLFAAGVTGILTRRNVIGVLISIELMLNAAAINLVVFSHTVKTAPETGQLFAFFVIALAAAGAAVGLAIVLALYRNRHTVQTDEMNLLKW